MSKTIAAVVAAFNRKELLVICVDSLLNQTRAIDRIFIIDNASTDGTFETLRDKGYLDNPVIEYVCLPENIGASGGIYEGMKRAHEAGYDFFWMMDDDAELRNDALSSLCHRVSHDLNGIQYYCLYSCHVERSLTYFTEPIVVIDKEKKNVISKFGDLDHSTLHEATGGPFLGFFLPRVAVDRIGLPNKDTFIWGDNEYFSRLREGGFRIFYDPKSLLFHPQHSLITIRIPVGLFKFSRPLWRPFSIPNGPLFKQYYGIRNFVILGCKEGRRMSAIMRGVLWGIVVIAKSSNKFNAVKFVFLALWDGVCGRMLMRFRP